MAKKNVLIVDDSPFVVAMVSSIVEGLGHFATKARDGEEGLRVAFRQVPDVIILDVKMPKVNGLEVLARLRNDERFKDTPIVMLSSVRDGDVIRSSIRQRATAYVLKDDPEQIKKRIKEVLE